MTDEVPAKRVTPKTVKPPDDADVLRLEEAAYLMRNSARSVRRLIADGKLRALTVSPSGSSLRVRREEVERYLRGAEFAERPETPDDKSPRSKRSEFQIKGDWMTEDRSPSPGPRRRNRSSD